MEKSFIKYLDNYEVGFALNHLEKFFWNFCDNYIEIVKHRLYRPEEFGDDPRYSGQKTIYTFYINYYKTLVYSSHLLQKKYIKNYIMIKNQYI